MQKDRYSSSSAFSSSWDSEVLFVGLFGMKSIVILLLILKIQEDRFQGY